MSWISTIESGSWNELFGSGSGQIEVSSYSDSSIAAFSDGSLTTYRFVGDNYVPADWTDTITAETGARTDSLVEA